MAAITATPLYDPFSHHRHLNLHHLSSSRGHSSHTSASSSSNDAILILDLLAVDHLIDSYTPLKHEESLWNALLAVDMECGRAHDRSHTNFGTAPALRDEREIFLDLLHTDQMVDNNVVASRSRSMELLHDSYARKVHSTMDRIVDNREDNVIMMQLLAMDESVDGTKRQHKFIASDEYSIIGEMYLVDCEVSGAQRRTLLVGDLQCLLDVDHFIDGFNP